LRARFVYGLARSDHSPAAASVYLTTGHPALAPIDLGLGPPKSTEPQTSVGTVKKLPLRYTRIARHRSGQLTLARNLGSPA